MTKESLEGQGSDSDRKDLETRLEGLVGKTTSGFELEKDGEILVIRFESGEKLSVPLSLNAEDKPEHYFVIVE